MPRLNKEHRVFVAGHTGLVGSAFVRRLRQEGYAKLLTCPRSELDLQEPNAVKSFFSEFRPETVIFCAARVGGILDNRKHPADFILDNMELALHSIKQAHRVGVKNFVFIASSCMYPRNCHQPMQEKDLLNGRPEETNLAHAIAKRAAVTLCLSLNEQYHSQCFLPLIATNTYGPRLEKNIAAAHVIPALIHKFHHAKTHQLPSIRLWGSGTAIREFIYVDDLVDACLHLLTQEIEMAPPPINVGSGEEVSIKALAQQIAHTVGYHGKINFDETQPDGSPRKLVDSSILRELGWMPQTPLAQGLKKTYQHYLKNKKDAKPHK